MPAALMVEVDGRWHRLPIHTETGAIDHQTCALSEAQVKAALEAHGVVLTKPPKGAKRHGCAR